MVIRNIVDKMKFNFFVFIFSLALILSQAYAQDSSEKNLNINEILLNKIEGLNTKIVDLERKVYQGNLPPVRPQSLNNEEKLLDLDGRAGHERRLLELEEKSRSIEGLIEELNYVRAQVEKLTSQNALLESKLDIINNKEINTGNNINNKQSIQEESIEEYPIYPGMANNNNNIDNNVLNIPRDKESDSTVEVLAKINLDSGEDEIIKTQLGSLEESPKKGVNNNIKNNSIVSTSKNPEEIYQRAYNLLSKGNYEAAEVAFIKFIKDYSDNNLASNAYYWLGETFYVRKNYQLAAYNFAAGYKKFPKGSKAADQLLKLGISLYTLNKNTEACTTFIKLDKEFSDAPSRISNRAKTFKEKLDCK